MEQNNPLITIIVPVYKVEEYLSSCIESILAQTYQNIEVILVDDGSPDKCGEICDEYTRRDSRIKVVHQQNQGVTKARSVGVSYAKGEFITFVDSDDTLPIDAVESLYLCVTPEIDIVIGKIYEQEKFPLDNSIKKSTSIIDIDSYRKFQLLQTFALQAGPYAKLFRQELFHKNIFDIPRSIIVGEDWLMNIRLSFAASQNVCFLNHIVYNYRRRPSSVTHQFRSNIEYEELFYNYYMQSIPETEKNKFLKATITQRLKGYFSVTGYSCIVPNKTTAFYHTLQNDIVRSGYKLPLMGKLLLYVKNPILRFLIIQFRKTLNTFNIYNPITEP